MYRYFLLVGFIGLVGGAAPPAVVQDGRVIRVGFANGHAVSYDTTQFRVSQIWQGSIETAPEHGRNLSIKVKPWQHKLRDLAARWTGYEVVGDNVTFRYTVALGRSVVAIEEQVAVTDDTVTLSFKLKHPERPFAMNYRLHQSAHRLVETTGQPRGRGQVQYLKDGQMDYRITIHLQNAGAHIPDGYRLETIAAPTLPKGYLFEPSGIDFAPDGTLYAATRTAGVWSYKNGSWKQFADGTYDALGLRVRKDGVYVMQKPELTRLVDEDGDGVADLYETVAAGFRFSGNYHEFAYGPRFDTAGNAYFCFELGCRRFS